MQYKRDFVIHISKDKTLTNVQSGTRRFDILVSDYVRKDDLFTYYSESMPITKLIQSIWEEIK